MSLSTKLRQKKNQSIMAQSLSAVTAALESLNVSKQAVGALFTPNVSTEAYKEFETVSENLSMSLESMAQVLGISVESSASAESRMAGVMAGLAAQDVRGFLSAPLTSGATSSFDKMGNKSTVMANNVISSMTGGDAMFERVATEAYDERENKNAAAYSVIYNMQASRQDEFGETFYPTIVVSPDNVGISITVRLMMVYEAITRNISGAITDYNKKNIIRAVADYTILKNDQTKVVPVARTQALAQFIDPALVAVTNVVLDSGEAVPTAPLKVGAAIDLIGISGTDALLAAGTLDMTDSLDPSIVLQNIYVSVTGTVGGTTHTDVISFNTGNLQLSTFNQSVQNNYRDMVLNFSTTSLMMNNTSLQNSGAALSVLAPIVTDNVIVRLSANVTGMVNIERGDTTVYGNQIGVHSVQDNSGNQLDLTTGVGAAIVAAFSTAKIVGYDLLAYRTNVNRRQRGQLIDTTFQTQIYNVPLRSPITAIRPVTTDGQNDAADLSALITATHIRTSNQAVTSLLQAATILAEYVDSRDTTSEGPDVLGVSRYLVRPTYSYEAVDMLTTVDSLSSSHRAEDIQSALVNKIRDHAYRLYRDSEFKAAADAMSGGVSLPPTVIIGTDPVIARYLTVTGDLRTLGNEFNVRIVSTLDKRMAGKIILTFGAFNGEQNAGPNPLHFGFMAWKPELTLTLPISRNNQISKELTCQPSFLHVTNMPILSVLLVENLADVLNKVSINTHVA